MWVIHSLSLLGGEAAAALCSFRRCWGSRSITDMNLVAVMGLLVGVIYRSYTGWFFVLETETLEGRGKRTQLL